MTGRSLKMNVLIQLSALVLLAQSCITDEFRVKDIAFDPEWEIGIVTPVFSGNLEFRDFIHDWKIPIDPKPGDWITLDFKDSTDLDIPVGILYDKSAVIDSLQFYIQGSYQFSAVDLVFTVENSSPLPLNLEMYFFKKKEYINFGPAIAPEPFPEANFSKLPVIPQKTVNTVSLSVAQLAYLIDGNRVRLVSWYGNNSFVNNNDTLSAHYPVNISITLVGKVKAKQND